MHRKYIRATVGTGDVDIPTGTFVANRFLYYNGISIITLVAVRGPASSTDNAVARFDGTTGDVIQNSTVIIDDAGNVTGVVTLNTRDPARWVDGPASGGSTDNAIARWDGTTGRLIQNSVVTISDTGAVTGVTTINGHDLDFVRGPTPAASTDNAITRWDGATGRLIQDSTVIIDDAGNITGVTSINDVPSYMYIFYTPTEGAAFVDEIAGFDVAAAPWSVSYRPVRIDKSGNVTLVNSLNGRDVERWTDGPAAGGSTDNAVALWDGTSGRLLKNSVVTINPSGDITTPGDMTPTTVGGIPVGVLVKSSGSSPHPLNAVTRWNNGTGHPLRDSTVFLSDAGAFTGVAAINTIDPSTWVVGPVASTSSNVALWNGTTGKLLQNSGIPSSQVVRNASGGSSAGAVVTMFNATATLVQPSVMFVDVGGNVTGVTTLNGVAPSRWVQGPASGGSTDNTLAVWDGTSGRLLKNGGASSIAVDPGTGEITTPVGVLQHSSNLTHTDNAVLRRDGTGQHVQDSTVIMDDSGNVTGLGTLNTRTIANWVESTSTFPTVDRILTVSLAGSRRIQPSGVAITDVVVGPASSVANNIAIFSGTSGDIISDSGVSVSSLSPLYSRNFTTIAGFAGGSGFDLFPSATLHTEGTTNTLQMIAFIPYQVADTSSAMYVTATWSGMSPVDGGIFGCVGMFGGAILSSGGGINFPTAAASIPSAGVMTFVAAFIQSSANPTLSMHIVSTGASHRIYAGAMQITKGGTAPGGS